MSYGNNIVAQVSPRMKEMVEWYIGKYAVARCFETPNVIALNEKLAEYGYKVCFMAEYFLPDVNKLTELPCDYEIKVLLPKDFECYYTNEWGNALCAHRKHLDKLAAWSNIKSVRNAIRCGFRPAWVELTARESEVVDDMNK